MIEDCTGLVLAGGAASRMGCDKTALTLGGTSLLMHAVEILRECFSEVWVSVREPRAGLPVPQVCDAPGLSGPLAGLRAGLAAAKTSWVFVLAADMPYLAPHVVAALAGRRGDGSVVVPRVGEVLQPLAAFYSVSCLDAMDRVLAAAGDGRMPGPRAMFPLLDVCEVDVAALDPHLADCFVDLDTPQDYAAAQRLEEKRK